MLAVRVAAVIAVAELVHSQETTNQAGCGNYAGPDALSSYDDCRAKAASDETIKCVCLVHFEIFYDKCQAVIWQGADVPAQKARALKNQKIANCNDVQTVAALGSSVINGHMKIQADPPLWQTVSRRLDFRANEENVENKMKDNAKADAAKKNFEAKAKTAIAGKAKTGEEHVVTHVKERTRRLQENSGDAALNNCLTVSPRQPGPLGENGFSCWDNLDWAKSKGIVQNPTWYPGLTRESSYYDFQMAIFDKRGNISGQGWSCPAPCSIAADATLGSVTQEFELLYIIHPAEDTFSSTITNLFAAWNSGIAEDLKDIYANGGEQHSFAIVDHVVTSSLQRDWMALSTTTMLTTMPTAAKTSSGRVFGILGCRTFGCLDQWWGWLLLVLSCLAILGAAAACVYVYFKDDQKPTPKKKKRASKLPSPSDSPEADSAQDLARGFKVVAPSDSTSAIGSTEVHPTQGVTPVQTALFAPQVYTIPQAATPMHIPLAVPGLYANPRTFSQESSHTSLGSSYVPSVGSSSSTQAFLGHARPAVPVHVPQAIRVDHALPPVAEVQPLIPRPTMY